MFKTKLVLHLDVFTLNKNSYLYMYISLDVCTQLYRT